MNGAVIALGFFDGVHLGHGALLREVRAVSERTELAPMAISFLGSIPGKPSGRLTPPRERVRLIRELYGVQTVLIPFTKELMEMAPEAFVEMLCREYGARHLVAGYDFTFGWKGSGKAENLRTLCREREIGCTIVPGLCVDGSPVSTTRIRSEITAGRIRSAAAMLGHPVTVTGTVCEGGVFLPPDDAVCPPIGTYLCCRGRTLTVSRSGYMVSPILACGELTLEIESE